MKLVHQINLAIGISLVFILTITAISIHYVLLDHFIGTEKNDLKALSAAMSTSIEAAEVKGTPVNRNFSPTLQALPLTTVTGPTQGLTTSRFTGTRAILTDAEGNINSWDLNNNKKAATLEPVAALQTELSPGKLQNIWDGKDASFVVAVSPIRQGTLTLLTPMSKIKEIEQALLGRLILVIFAIVAIMFLISLFITKKLIQPLMNLRQELKKVKERQFTDVKLIKAGGEIGVVAHTVFEMAHELNRFNQVQKQFFQNASHELKTPVMSISGYAEGIRDGIFEGDQVRKGLDIILYESKRLGDIVTEMTLLAKLDSEEDIFEPEAISLKELLTEALERTNPLLVKKDIQHQLICPPDADLMIMADQDKLLQALLNVIVNAVRYAKSQIVVEARHTNGSVVLHVSDDGPGIQQELMGTLFHRFVKGKDGESGLGLAISRAIVERCGGLIQADNNKEGGARITFSFPAAAL